MRNGSKGVTIIERFDIVLSFNSVPITLTTLGDQSTSTGDKLSKRKETERERHK